MKIDLRKISLNDDLEGLSIINKMVNDEKYKSESPIEHELDEYLYNGFLLLSEEEANNLSCIRYWVTLDNNIIGYADIKNDILNNEVLSSNIGIFITNEYRNKGIGLEVIKLLLEKAKSELKTNQINIVTGKNNKGMKNICEKLSIPLLYEDDNLHYMVK